MRDARPARRRRLDTLGSRLLVAFALVSLVSVAILAVAAQQAVDRGLAIASSGGRLAVATALAEDAARAYADAGSWEGADVDAVLAAADDDGVRAAILDAEGVVVAESRSGSGAGAGAGAGGGRAGGASAAVVVGGEVVGAVVVAGGPPVGAGSDAWVAARAEARGRDVAWSWIVGAGLLALGVAVLAAWLVTRALTRPLTALTTVTRDFAGGERGVRADETAAGEIGELARGFNDAAESVERSAAQRRQMAADVAHELRTPLAALQAGLEEVRDGLVPADAETLTRLHDQSLRLGRVIDDLRALAEPVDGAAGLVPGRVDLARIVAEELSARGAELRSAGVVLGPVELEAVEVVADADRVHQVVGNLLANVARHCPAGTEIDVSVGRDGGDAVLRVADDGPGLTEQERRHAFDRYWRGPSAGVGGSGLGLAVVREVVAAHHGTVALESVPGVGTAVTVRLRAYGAERARSRV